MRLQWRSGYGDDIDSVKQHIVVTVCLWHGMIGVAQIVTYWTNYEIRTGYCMIRLLNAQWGLQAM